MLDLSHSQKLTSARRARDRWQDVGELPRWTDSVLARLLPLMAVLIVAILFRVYRLDTVPPGLFHDEAANGLDVLDILRGQYAVFFERNLGREPLFIYLQAISVFLFGNSALALRAVSAAVGALTVLATFFIAREWFGYRIGLLSMFWMAVAFWHVDLSRVGLRAISSPLLLTLSLLFLWQGFRERRAWCFALAGLFVGLSLYTYTSARAIVALLCAVLVVEFLADREALLRQWPSLAMFGVIGLITVAPLGVYFAYHPDSFLGRTMQVSLVGGEGPLPTRLAILAEGLQRTLGMFLVAGDPNWRHNLQWRPVFTPIGGPFFILGFVWAAISAVKPRAAQTVTSLIEDRPSPCRLSFLAVWWLILWLLITTIPGILSNEGPHFLRLMPMAPSVFIVGALGLTATWKLAGARFGRRANPALALCATMVICWEGLATFHDYFEDWANRPQVYWAFDTNMSDAVKVLRQINQEVPDDSAIFFVNTKNSPVFEFLASKELDDHEFIRDHDFSLVLPGGAERDIYLLMTPGVPQGLLSKTFPDAPVYYRAVAPDGATAFTIYKIPREQVLAFAKPEIPVNVAFGDEVELVGVSKCENLSDGLVPGESAHVLLLWRLHIDPHRPLNFFVHCLDEKGRRWAQWDLSGEGIEFWRKGDLVLTRHDLTVPIDTPTIPMTVVAGVMDESSGERLRPATADPGNVIRLWNVDVARSTRHGLATLDLPPCTQGQSLIPGLEVLRYDISGTKAKPGESLGVEVVWRLAAPLLKEPKIEIRLIDALGQVRARQEGAPGYDHCPFSTWSSGDIVSDPRSVPIPGSVPTGELRAVLVAVDPDTGQTMGEIQLGVVTLEEFPRDYSLPARQHALDIDFGGEIRLVGYDLHTDRAVLGGEIELTLYWQAIKAPSANYTVFVHLIDEGEVIIGQRDNPPVEGTRPTTGWLPSEVIRDPYRIAVKVAPRASEVALAVGLYDPSTGKRVAVRESSDGRVFLGRIMVGSR
ncbi:MAG: ArnT family glycosyltransferase [Anaerolineae bacterium]